MNTRNVTSSSRASGEVAAAGAFVPTRWSVVIAAGRNDTTRAQAALESLCRVYWRPLYHYVRRRGHGIEDAQDLTQAFFARLLQRNWLSSAEKEKGRFRTFLLTALERFLANEWDKERTLKRGGGRAKVPIQIDTAETRYGIDPADHRTPEQDFEYRWAMVLLEEVLQRLASEYTARGQAGLLRRCDPAW